MKTTRTQFFAMTKRDADWGAHSAPYRTRRAAIREGARYFGLKKGDVLFIQEVVTTIEHVTSKVTVEKTPPLCKTCKRTRNDCTCIPF